MSLPKNRKGLMELGWRFSSNALCKGVNCRRRIEWWITPGGKPCTMEASLIEGVEEIAAHWVTCPDAKQFKSKPDPKQGGLF